MSGGLTVGVVQMSATEDDRSGTVARACEQIGAVAALGADLVVLPEFFDTPYFAQHREPAYQDLAEPADGHTVSAVRAAARRHGVWVCATMYEHERPGWRFDTAFVIDRAGEIAGKYRKVHAPAIAGLEKLYYRQGSRFGVWEVDGVRVGVAICYDVYFPETVRSLTLAGAELILAPFAALEQPLWIELMRVRGLENGVYLAVCNKVGTESTGWEHGGRSMVVGPDGDLLHVAGPSEPETFVVALQCGAVDRARRRFPMLRDRRPECYAALCRTDEDNLALR